MNERSRNSLLFVLVLLLLTACAAQRAEFDRQLKICGVAETNGVLITAVDACRSALLIADAREYPSAEIADVTYRLARLERQSGDFVAAHSLLQRSLALVASDEVGIACRNIELSLTLAGQGRWDEAGNAIAASGNDYGGLSALDREMAKRAAGVVAERMSEDAQRRLNAELKAIHGLPSTDEENLRSCFPR